jgi:hypothetical protein
VIRAEKPQTDIIPAEFAGLDAPRRVKLALNDE